MSRIGPGEYSGDFICDGCGTTSSNLKGWRDYNLFNPCFCPKCVSKMSKATKSIFAGINKVLNTLYRNEIYKGKRSEEVRYGTFLLLQHSIEEKFAKQCEKRIKKIRSKT